MVDRRSFLPIFNSAWIFSDRRPPKIFNTFFVLKVLMYLRNLDGKKCFLILFKIYEDIFYFFYFRDLIRDHLWQLRRKKSRKYDFEIFSNDFHHISHHISISIRYIRIISTIMSSWDIRLKSKTLIWRKKFHNCTVINFQQIKIQYC